MTEEQESINFEELNEVEVNEGMEELGLEDLESSSNFIRHPKVGEEIIVDIAKVYKDKNILY